MKHRITALITAIILLFTCVLSAGAAEVDNISGAPLGSSGGDLEYEPDETELYSELPSRYSSAELGYTTGVRTQLYNTCWAYCSTAVLETFTFRNTGYSPFFSPMHINYWGTTDENGKGWKRSYADSGYPYIALGYLTSFGALNDDVVPQDTTYDEYSLYKDRLYPCNSVDGIRYFNSTDINTIKSLIYNYGSVTGNFHFNDRYSLGYRSYYCDEEGLATHQLNGHAVAVVGWDDDYSKYNFMEGHQPESNGAWICKNSWGKYMGDNGYIWISYEDNYLFDSRFGPSFAVTHTNKMTAINTIKQNEIYGATYEFDYINSNNLTFVNTFDFSDRYKHIDRIAFESSCEGAPYSVYYIPLDPDGVPLNDKSQWTLLHEGTIDYKGYHTVSLNGFTPPDEKGAIGISISKPSQSARASIGVCEWLSRSGEKFFEPETKRGDSYIIGFRSAPMDLMDFYYKYSFEPGTNNPDLTGGTFVIKALCYSDDLEGDVDRDGEFDIVDVTLTQRMLADMITLTDEQMRYADFDNDWEVSIVDCTAMQRALVA